MMMIDLNKVYIWKLTKREEEEIEDEDCWITGNSNPISSSSSIDWFIHNKHIIYRIIKWLCLFLSLCHVFSLSFLHILDRFQLNQLNFIIIITVDVRSFVRSFTLCVNEKKIYFFVVVVWHNNIYDLDLCHFRWLYSIYTIHIHTHVAYTVKFIHGSIHNVVVCSSSYYIGKREEREDVKHVEYIISTTTTTT